MSENGVNGTNGSSVSRPTSTIEADTKVARYRTALVALLALITRDKNEYRSWPDQMLIAQIQRLLDEDDNSPK